MDKVRVGMIGAGDRARHAQCPSLANMGDVNMAVICELGEDLMKNGEKSIVSKRSSPIDR